jgi:hypothetical protein
LPADVRWRRLRYRGTEKHLLVGASARRRASRGCRRCGRRKWKVYVHTVSKRVCDGPGIME